MSSKSVPRGEGTLAVQVSGLNDAGFWLALDSERLFVPFSEFPWFRGVDEDRLRRVERPRADHLYWPELDIDLAVQSIRDPKAFPLVSRKQ